MAAYRGTERRNHIRSNKKFGVNIIAYKGKSTLPKLDAEIGINIAVGGVLIECAKRLTKGSSLKLKIMLTFGSKYKIIRTTAKVSWNKKSFRNTYYHGCRFARLSPADKRTLIKFIKEK